MEPQKGNVHATPGEMKRAERRRAMHQPDDLPEAHTPVLVGSSTSDSENDLAKHADSDNGGNQIDTESVGSNWGNSKFTGLLEEGPPQPLIDQPTATANPDVAVNPDVTIVAFGSTSAYDNLTAKYVLPQFQCVKIPVELMRNPGPDFCSQPFQRKRCVEIANSMMKNSSQVPSWADVVPISKVDHDELKVHTLVQMKGMSRTEIRRKIHECYFITISGQHSSQAMILIREEAKLKDNAHLKGMADKLQYRQCRILVGDLPAAEYISLGLMSNPDFPRMIYDQTFIEKVEHIRSSYHHSDCPPRPTPGLPMSDKYKWWESYAKMILGVSGKSKHTPFHHMQWAIFASDETFNLWKDLCHAFLKGTIPDRHGDILPAKKGLMVQSGFFKSLEGDISERQIFSILTDVKNHKVLLSKSARGGANACNKDSIQDVATKYKDRSFSQRLFLCKLQHDFGDTMGDIATWDDLAAKCPSLQHDFEVLHSLLGADVVTKKRKHPSPDLVPEACATLLRKLWTEVE